MAAVQPLSAEDAAHVAQPAPDSDGYFDMRRYQLARLLPVLRALGYDGAPSYTTLRGLPFQVSVGYNVHDEQFFTGAKAQLYDSDCYGVTGKGEAVLHLWNWTGSHSKGECLKVAAALTAAGIPARATRYKKCDVVAYHAGESSSAATLHYEARLAYKRETASV